MAGYCVQEKDQNPARLRYVDLIRHPMMLGDTTGFACCNLLRIASESDVLRGSTCWPFMVMTGGATRSTSVYLPV